MAPPLTGSSLIPHPPSHGRQRSKRFPERDGKFEYQIKNVIEPGATQFFLRHVHMRMNLQEAMDAPCVYRKPKPAHNGDEARQGSRVNLLIQSAEQGARPAHLCLMTNAV